MLKRTIINTVLFMRNRKFYWIIPWLIVGCMTIFIFLEEYNTEKTKKNIEMLVKESYNIDGIIYPSYSMLKYIATNELSHEEVQSLLSKCGYNPKKATRSTQYFQGDFGRLSIQILGRSNSNDLIRYEFMFSDYNKSYYDMIKSEVMSENNVKNQGTGLYAIIDDYWWVGVMSMNPMCIVFQRFKSKKISR